MPSRHTNTGNDPNSETTNEAVAEKANLVYASDSERGITRIRDRKSTRYSYNKKRVTDNATLLRIKSLAIPPAWTEVWICANPNGHLQATGRDTIRRKQYRYHPRWNKFTSQTKFDRLYEFGKALPLLRKKIRKDIACPKLNREKVLATIILLMEQTTIRVGNSSYEKLHDSYGLTTLKDDHVKIRQGSLRFSFKGKKGISQSVTLKNKRLARIVKACRDIPGKELFQYFNEEGERCPIDSGMVNDYIRSAMGNNFSSKDFRTWAGSITMLRALKEHQATKDAKKNIIDALDEVSKILGNTRAVCRKYYVHPKIIQLYEENFLEQHLKHIGNEVPEINLSMTEKVLMKIVSPGSGRKSTQIKKTIRTKKKYIHSPNSLGL